MPQQDWFAQHAPPAAAAPPSGDWFASNAPTIQRPMFHADNATDQSGHTVVRDANNGAALNLIGLNPSVAGLADPVVDVFKGAAKRALASVGTLGEIARWAAPRVTKRMDALMAPVPVNVTPTNTAQKVGGAVEQFAEFAAPLSLVSKGVAAASIPARMAAEGAASAGMGAFQSKGDPTATLAAGAGGAVAPVIGIGAQFLGKAATRAAAGAREGGIGGAVAEAVRRSAPVSPHAMLTQALKPTATNTGFMRALAKAVPEIKASEQAIGKPIENLSDFQAAIGDAKKRLWGMYQQMAGPRAKVGVDLSPVANAMVQSIPSRVKLQDPAAAAAIARKADAYRRMFTIDEAETFLREANADLDSFYKKYPAAQRKAMDSDPEVAHLVKEGQALRSAIYSVLDSPGEGAAAAEVKRRYGALLNLENETFRRANVAARQQPESLNEQISTARAAGEIARGAWKTINGNPMGLADIAAGYAGRDAARFMKAQQTTDALIRRAMSAVKDMPTPINIPPAPRIAGLLGSGPIITPPPVEASGGRGVSAWRDVQYSGTPKQLPPGRQVIHLGGEVQPEAPAVNSVRAAPIDYHIDPTVTVKAGGFTVKQFSGDPAAAKAAVATPEVRAMLERMRDDLGVFKPQRGRHTGVLNAGEEEGFYSYGTPGSPVGDDVRVISEQNVGNDQIAKAINDLLAGKTPTNRLHTGALDAAMGYLEKRPGYRGPSVPAGLNDIKPVEDDGFEAFSNAVDELAGPERALPPRSANTMSDAISVSSPNGRVSKRSQAAAQERIRQELFGKDGLQLPAVAQPSEADALIRKAKGLRELAARGVKPRAYIKQAEEWERQAEALKKGKP
jgi:hypothetical protein